MAIEATRLRGHKRSVLCCAASPTTPHLISSSGEDGSVYWFDLRCKENASVMDLGKEPVASVCFSPGNDDILYAAYANTVTCLDVRMAPSSGQLQKYTFNTEDINQVLGEAMETNEFISNEDTQHDLGHQVENVFATNTKLNPFTVKQPKYVHKGGPRTVKAHRMRKWVEEDMTIESANTIEIGGNEQEVGNGIRTNEEFNHFDRPIQIPAYGRGLRHTIKSRKRNGWKRI